MAEEPSLPPSLESPAVLASVGKQAVAARAQGGESAAPGPGVLLWPYQHGHGEDAGDASWAEATAEHATRLCLVAHMAQGDLTLERAKPSVGVAAWGVLCLIHND